MSAVPSAGGAFLSDVETLRKRAREHVAQGAVDSQDTSRRAVQVAQSVEGVKSVQNRLSVERRSG